MLELLGQYVYLAANAPVHAFNLGAGAQVHYPVAEQVERLLAYLLCVVPVFKHGARVQVVPDVIQVAHELVAALRGFVLLLHLRQRRRLEHVDDEHRVVRRERASALGYDVRVGQAVAVGRVDKGIDTVVDVLLYGVVHRAFAAGRACAVVVYAEPSAAVHEVDVVAQLVQLYVKLRRFAQRSLYAAYLRYLAPYVEVYQPQAVAHVLLVEQLERVEQLGARQAELAGVAAAVLPLATARGGQLYAYAEVRADVELLGHAGYGVKLVELLHDDEYALAHLLGEQGQLYVALVLVAVADDERVALALHGYHRVQFRLGACLEPEVELAPVAYYLLHHRLHLVYLYGVDDEVLALVFVLGGGLAEAAAGLLDAVVEDVGEAEQHRRGDVAQGEFVHHVAQVNLCLVLAWRDIDVPAVVHAEVGCAPSVDVVKLLGVLNGPLFHFSSCSWVAMVIGFVAPCRLPGVWLVIRRASS